MRRRAARGSPTSRSSAAASRSTSRSSTGTFQTASSGQLREPADVADDERPAERERADRAPRGLAHRRRAQADDDVAARHQRPEPLLGDVLLAHGRTPSARPSRRASRRAAGRARAAGADEQQPRLGPRSRARARTPRAAAGCACSGSDGRGSRSPGRRRASAGSTSGAGQAGCGMRQTGPVVARARDALLDVARVDDQAVLVRRVEHEPGERELLRPLSQSGGRQPSTTPSASRRPTSPRLALHRRRGRWPRRGARASARRRGGGARARAGRRPPAGARSASTIQPCASGSLPTW